MIARWISRRPPAGSKMPVRTLGVGLALTAVLLLAVSPGAMVTSNAEPNA